MKKLIYALVVLFALAWLFTDEIVYAHSKPKVLHFSAYSYPSKLTSEELSPKLIKSVSIRVDVKNDISYIKKGEMEIYGGILLADELTFDLKHKVVITKQATFKDREGRAITGDNFTFDYSKGIYKVTGAASTSNVTIHTNTSADADQIEYTAKDSVSVNKLTKNLYLYGDVKLSSGNSVYQADRMIYNHNEQTLKVQGNASVYDKKGKVLAKADSLTMNLKTGKGIFFGKVLHKYDH